MTEFNLKIEDRQIETYVKTHTPEKINKDIIKFLAEKIIKEQQEKATTKKSKWGKFAEKLRNESLLSGKSEEVVKMNKEFRENFIF